MSAPPESPHPNIDRTKFWSPWRRLLGLSMGAGALLYAIGGPIVDVDRDGPWPIALGAVPAVAGMLLMIIFGQRRVPTRLVTGVPLIGTAVLFAAALRLALEQQGTVSLGHVLFGLFAGVLIGGVIVVRG